MKKRSGGKVDLVMNEQEYEDFYNKVGKINGWDFSHLIYTTEGVNWDFYTEVKKRCKSSDILLDIGTGGGENVMSIAPSFLFLIGIDLSAQMIQSAQTNLMKSKIKNARFLQMSSEQIQFPNEFFNVVSSRHAPFQAKEVARVVADGGLFLTQQVSEGDKWNIKQTFERGQSYGEIDGSAKERYIKQLKEAGFSKVEVFDYNATEYYARPEDLLFLLKHTPIIPHFGEQKDDYKLLDQFINNNQTEKGIRTNAKRYLLIARK